MKFHGIAPTLFGSPARAAVLTTMLRYGREELTGREVARRAGVSAPRAIEALRVLEREHLCFQRRVGRASLWKLDSGHFLAKRLAPLADLESAPRGALIELLSRNLAGAAEAYLFGSVAQGTDEWDSDVDLLLVFKDEHAKARFQARLPALQDEVLAKFGNHLQPVAYTARSLARPGPRHLLEKARASGLALEAAP